MSLKEREDLADLTEKKELEAAVITRLVPKSLEKSPEKEAKREKRREMLDYQRIDPIKVEEESDVEPNVEPKNLSSHLFKFNLDLNNLNGILDRMQSEISGLQETCTSQQEQLSKKPETQIMTKYFERMAQCIKEECGKLPH
jgi:hypothetical protein